MFVNWICNSNGMSVFQSFSSSLLFSFGNVLFGRDVSLCIVCIHVFLIPKGARHSFFQRNTSPDVILFISSLEGYLINVLHYLFLCIFFKCLLTFRIQEFTFKDSLKVAVFLSICTLFSYALFANIKPSLPLSPLANFFPGALYSRMQVQGECVWELLCYILLHALSPDPVWPLLVYRYQPWWPDHEGQSGQEDQGGCTLPA